MDYNIVISAVPAGIMGVIWWDIRTIRKEIKTNNKEISLEIRALSEKHHNCQKELPEKYAGKQDTRANFLDIFKRAEALESATSYLKGKLNGG